MQYCRHARVIDSENTSKGGVAFIFRESPTDWLVEDPKQYGPNVIAITLISGEIRRRLIRENK